MSTASDPNIKHKEVPPLELDSEEKRKAMEAKTKNKAVSSAQIAAAGTSSARVSDKRPNTNTSTNPPAKTKKANAPPPTSALGVGAKRHRFVKKNFAHPTWCPFHNKFISGLNKSGYECRDCHLPVSRRFIGEAKNTVCGEAYDSIDTGFTGQQAQAITKNKVFTVYLPHGAKKSVLLNPVEPLRNVLEKLCAARGINMNEYVPEDTNGNIVSLDTQLGKILGYEITFTSRDTDAQPSPQASASGTSTPSTPDDDPDSKKKAAKTASKGKRKSQKIDGKKVLTATSTNSGANTPVPNSPLSNSNPSVTTLPAVTATTSTTSTTLPSPTAAATVSTPTKQLHITEAYDIGRELGSGAFSVVKEAKHKETGRVVAVKILDKYEDDDEQTQKFKQEISIISSLHHDNIVQFYELDDDEENFYVAMELVGGGELFDYIIENGTIQEKEAACIIAQVLKAVEYMHSIGTAHRDLKPENLLFKSEDRKIIKIADFGESKSFKEGNLTTYCGTPDYMAPEIIKGEPYGSAVDIWAIGVITYVMLAGFPPFDGENDVEVFASILAVRYDFPSPEWDGISSDGKDFVASILLEDASQRLTATQCLNHPWIVKNVPLDMRVNAPKEPSPREDKNNSSDDAKSSDHSEDDEKKDEPKLLDAINECMKLANEAQSVHAGELKAMADVVEVFVKNGKTVSGTEVEKSVFSIYWSRLKELQSLVKSGKKEKEKKKKK